MGKVFTSILFGISLINAQFISGVQGAEKIEEIYKEGLKLRDKKELSGAKNLFMQVVEQSERKHVKALHNVGMIFYQEKDFINAAKFFKEAGQLKFEPSQRNLWRMIIAKEIPSTDEERFLAVCDLNCYPLPIPREKLTFSITYDNLINTGTMFMPFIHLLKTFNNTGFIRANIIWLEEESGLQSIGTINTNLFVVGTKRVI